MALKGWKTFAEEWACDLHSLMSPLCKLHSVVIGFKLKTLVVCVGWPFQLALCKDITGL